MTLKEECKRCSHILDLHYGDGTCKSLVVKKGKDIRCSCKSFITEEDISI